MNINSDMVINKKVSKIWKLVGVVFVGTVFVDSTFVGTVLVTFINSSRIISESPILLHG